MKDIKITKNHPIKKRYILGPLGRIFLKIINWDIIGNLPDKKRIIIASAPHSSSFDSIYAFFVCLASDLKFYFLGSISMFTRIVIPIPFNFRFYGVDYNEITVAADGYIALGRHEVPSHRNYPIPGAGGPSPMIAPFWNDLRTSTGEVYKYTTNPE